MNKSTLSWSKFKPDNFFSGSLDAKIFLWDRRHNQHVTEFNTIKKVKRIAADPLNEFNFAVGNNDGSVHIWDIRSNMRSI